MEHTLRQLQQVTRQHRSQHGCGAYTFEDGDGLMRIIRKYQPQRILELGCALGYTAACMAYAAPSSSIDTIEGDQEHVRLARQSLAQLPFSHSITVHQGDFLEVLASLNTRYDLIFFDGYQPSTHLIKTLLTHLSVGGILVCANVNLVSAKQFQAIIADSTLEWLENIEHQQTAVYRKSA